MHGSPSAEHALAWAVEQAALEQRPLLLAYAVSPDEEPDRPGTDFQVGSDVRRAHGHVLLRAARDGVEERDGSVEVHTALEVTDPRRLLSHLSETASMLVLGSHGRGPVGSLVMRSVGLALTQRARCPLVIHRPAVERRGTKGVLVGVDGPSGSGEVLRFALRQASLRRLPLTVQHSAWELQGSWPKLVDLYEEFPDVAVRRSVPRGHPVDCLVREGVRADLIVVGRDDTLGPSRLAHGSLAVRVVEHAACPVAVVPVQSR